MSLQQSGPTGSLPCPPERYPGDALDEEDRAQTNKGRSVAPATNAPAPKPLLEGAAAPPLLFGILLLAAFLRLHQFTVLPPGFYVDESMYGNNAMEALETGHFHVFYPEDNGREGLYINLVAFSVKVFGNQPWAVRLPSVFFGVATVWVSMRWARNSSCPRSAALSCRNPAVLLCGIAPKTVVPGLWQRLAGVLGHRRSGGESPRLVSSKIPATSPGGLRRYRLPAPRIPLAI